MKNLKEKMPQIYERLESLQNKEKVTLFSRMQRNLKQTPLFMNVNYPIGKENAVVGGVYL